MRILRRLPGKVLLRLSLHSRPGRSPSAFRFLPLSQTRRSAKTAPPRLQLSPSRRVASNVSVRRKPGRWPAGPGGWPPGPPGRARRSRLGEWRFAPSGDFRVRKSGQSFWSSVRSPSGPGGGRPTGVARRSPGRPRLNPSSTRTLRLSFRVTEAEVKAIDSRATLAGLDRSTYVRRAALGARIVALRVPAIHLAAIGQLQRIGNNLNQSVKLVHEGRLSSEFGPALREVQRLLLELRRALRGETTTHGSAGDSE